MGYAPHPCLLPVDGSRRDHPWHPVFLKRWQGVACLRFMDWMETNASTRRWSKWGSWGILQHSDGDPARSPKFMTTLRWARAMGQAVNVPG